MKIGIVTHYFNSRNYGGILQSFALTEFLKCNGESNAEQICYDFNNEQNKQNLVEVQVENVTLRKKIQSKDIKGVLYPFYIRIKKRYLLYKNHQNKELYNKKLKVFKGFEERIPHKQGIVEKGKLECLNSDYEAYIAGSDQIWNPNWYHDEFYLTFASKEKIKLSYAASMGVNEIIDKSAEKIIPLINRFDYVSVREKSAKDLINRYTDKEVTVVCDPVLLLNQHDWNKVAVSPMANEKYVYTYLLGERKINRDLTTKVADVMNLPLVTVPYIHLQYNDYDKKFGDIQLNEVGPAEFVGLIRDSEIVVTDSFHAVVFSLIYNKKFVALKRNLDTETGSMNSRITDLLDEMGLSNRIIESIDEVTDEFITKEIDFSYANRVIKEKKIISIEFLKKAFTGTEIEHYFIGELEKQKG